MKADVLVVGAGIAGLCAAYYASRAGRRVVIVDAGVQRASGLPLALINPLRGHAGRLIGNGIDGLKASVALIDALNEAGHRVASGRGVFRPLIGVDAVARERAYWTERLASRLAFDWYDVAPAALGLREAVPALRLRDAAWVRSDDLLAALRAASGASLVVGRVERLAADGRGGGAATLADGTTIVARSLVWCGGAWGAARLDAGGPSDGTAFYKPGTLLALDAAVTSAPLTFGLYAAPWSDGPVTGTIVGPTREDGCTTFPTGDAPASAIAEMTERVAHLFAVVSTPRPVWRGVRLVRMSATASAALAGIPMLTAFGSRGFLMAPLRASEWARSL